MEAFEIRPYREGDEEHLQTIRRLAFQPIHDGFREQLGDEIYEKVRGDAEQKQAEYLDTLIAGGRGKELYVLLHSGSIAGFIGLVLDDDGIGGVLGMCSLHLQSDGRFATARCSR